MRGEKRKKRRTIVSDEQNKLTSQRERLYKAEDYVVELVKTLDDQKDSTLIKTFENVNLHFGTVRRRINDDDDDLLIFLDLGLL